MTKPLRQLTQDWGSDEDVDLYLERCQVDTPSSLVGAVWSQISARRQDLGKVVDFGAGDGRFSRGGSYRSYVGYEVDSRRTAGLTLPPSASLLNQCAFDAQITDADVCVGNPPFVRNQDLPRYWRDAAAAKLLRRTGVAISGLANAWQYFALLALASTKDDGLIALVVPFEWVTRPSSAALRDYIKRNNWSVAAYRLMDRTFPGVLTTASITVIDKRDRRGRWEFYEEHEPGSYRLLDSPNGTASGVLSYSLDHTSRQTSVRVARGLSPGTQRVLTLTERERAHNGLRIGTDVVACITSLRPVSIDHRAICFDMFRSMYKEAGRKCWLIRTDRQPSLSLSAYLDGVPKAERNTVTCQKRDQWWKFSMPDPPAIVVASGFRGRRPKAVVNSTGAVAVGAVYGVYGLAAADAVRLVESLSRFDVASHVLSHSRGLRKLEPGQLKVLLTKLLSEEVSG